MRVFILTRDGCPVKVFSSREAAEKTRYNYALKHKKWREMIGRKYEQRASFEIREFNVEDYEYRPGLCDNYM